jgi:CubicO group peptidase (beta-lactamase class C family)
MKKTLLLSLIIAMGLPGYEQTNRTALTDNPLKTWLDSAVQAAATIYLQDSNTNGISLGICWKDKDYTYNYGEAMRGSGQLPTANHYYNLGSVAKTFVALMLSEAVAQGKAKLTDDIRKYLPGSYPNLAYDGQPIRLVDLANHTSALPQQFHRFPQAVMDSLGKLGSAAQINYFNHYNQDSLLKDLHTLKPDTIPGTRFQYNGNAMMLLMLLMERVYHQPFEAIVTNYLQHQLGMYHTKTILSNTEIKQMAQGYNQSNQPQHYRNYTGFTGGPSMNSTINDMLKYLRANMEEKDEAIRLSHVPTYSEKDGFTMGLGWMMDSDENGDRFLFHDGHTGTGFNTRCIFYPELQLGIVVIVNDITDQGKVTEMEKTIRQAIREHERSGK